MRLCTKSDKLHLHRALQEVDWNERCMNFPTHWPTPGSTVLLETNSPSAGHEIRCFVCNLQSHYRVHMTTTMVPIPRQIYPVHITSYFGNVHFSTTFQFTYYFPKASSTQVSDWHSVALLITTVYATCPVNLILFWQNIWGFWLRKFIQPRTWRT